jgi:prepilin-type N-terminal cleavage/methylation domain-containing protein
MKPTRSTNSLPSGRRTRPLLAFTLPEVMVSTAIFSLMALGVILTAMFGLRWDQLVISKLGATEKARMSFDLLMNDIRGSKKWNIGTGSRTSFNAYSNQNTLIGGALQLYADANNTNSYTRYWFDTSRGWLCRMTSDNTNSFTIIAQYLTNASGTGMTFQAQDYNGKTLMDLTYKYVILANMEFYQYQYPVTRVGPGNYYDYYRIQVLASSHAPN